MNMIILQGLFINRSRKDCTKRPESSSVFKTKDKEVDAIPFNMTLSLNGFILRIGIAPNIELCRYSYVILSKDTL